MTFSKEEFKSYRLLFHAFSSYHSSWDSGMFSEKYNDNWQILTFDDLWWPQYCSKVKNDRNTFKRTYWELSTAFYRVFLALLVFELKVGGNICPPSLGRSWPRPPLGRGLNLADPQRTTERFVLLWVTVTTANEFTGGFGIINRRRSPVPLTMNYSGECTIAEKKWIEQMPNLAVLSTKH